MILLSPVSLNIVKDPPSHLRAAQQINDIDENSTPRIKKKKGIHVEEKTGAKSQAGMFPKHITMKKVKVLIGRNNTFENKGKNKGNPDQCDEDCGDDDDNTENMNSNHDLQPGSSHECRCVASPEYEMADENIDNNRDVNENNTNTGKCIIF
ncbi:hypothetical protein PV326_012792 [Microctonus aethiopoides]|nr:hypothetical protein PV326_012792 [Microctonus aethiopoides]